MDAVRSALAVHRSRVTELLRAWDKDVDTVDFRTFSRALALLDLKVDPQDALALFDEFEPEEGSVSLDDLEYKLRVNAGLLKEGAAEATKPRRLGTTTVSPHTLSSAGWKSSVPASVAFHANRD